MSGYSTTMPFDVGEHRSLPEIDERDVFSIALDADVPADDFLADVAELVSRLESVSSSGLEGPVSGMVDRILEDAKPRMAVASSLLNR